MPTYLYKAIDQSGKTIRGKMTAPNEFELENRLKDQQQDLLDATIHKQGVFGLGAGVSLRDLVTFCVHLEQLERAGVPVLDSLEDLRDSADSQSMKEILSELYDDVNNGDVLSAAMAKHPAVFDEIFVGLVAAGEKTGNLPEALEQMASHLRWNDEFRKKIKQAIRYPIILLVLMSAVIAVMMLFVVPQLTDFLTSQGFDLPAHTVALIAFSEFFAKHWLAIFSIPVLGIIATIIGYKANSRFRYIVDTALLKIPFIGNVILKINMVRFTHFFAITFQSGISVLECLEVGRKVVNNSVMQGNIADIAQYVSDGLSITQSIERTEQFPGLVIRMFRVGEESGNMSNALGNISYFYDREVRDAVDSLTGMIQPMLTIVMGAMMFWVISAVFGPLYQSFSNINI